MAEQFNRMTSFAERYVIERASHFRVGHEQEDAWAAIQHAKTIYGMIQRDPVINPDANHGSGEAQQAAVPQQTPPSQAELQKHANNVMDAYRNGAFGVPNSPKAKSTLNRVLHQLMGGQ